RVPVRERVGAVREQERDEQTAAPTEQPAGAHDECREQAEQGGGLQPVELTVHGGLPLHSSYAGDNVPSEACVPPVNQPGARCERARCTSAGTGPVGSSSG